MGALWRVGGGQGVSDSDLSLYVQVILHHPLTKSKGCNASVWNQYVSAVTFMNFIGVVNVNNTSLFLSTDDNRAYIILKDTHTTNSAGVDVSKQIIYTIAKIINDRIKHFPL